MSSRGPTRAFNARSGCRKATRRPARRPTPSPCPFLAVPGGPTCPRDPASCPALLMSNVRNRLSSYLCRLRTHFHDTSVGAQGESGLNLTASPFQSSPISRPFQRRTSGSPLAAQSGMPFNRPGSGTHRTVACASRTKDRGRIKQAAVSEAWSTSANRWASGETKHFVEM